MAEWTEEQLKAIAAACDYLDEQAELLPCAEDAVVTHENADLLRGWAGLKPHEEESYG